MSLLDALKKKPCSICGCDVGLISRVYLSGDAILCENCAVNTGYYYNRRIMTNQKVYCGLADITELPEWYERTLEQVQQRFVNWNKKQEQYQSFHASRSIGQDIRGIAVLHVDDETGLFCFGEREQTVPELFRIGDVRAFYRDELFLRDDEEDSLPLKKLKSIRVVVELSDPDIGRACGTLYRVEDTKSVLGRKKQAEDARLQAEKVLSTLTGLTGLSPLAPSKTVCSGC